MIAFECEPEKNSVLDQTSDSGASPIDSGERQSGEHRPKHDVESCISSEAAPSRVSKEAEEEAGEVVSSE